MRFWPLSIFVLLSFSAAVMATAPSTTAPTTTTLKAPFIADSNTLAFAHYTTKDGLTSNKISAYCLINKVFYGLAPTVGSHYLMAKPSPASDRPRQCSGLSQCYGAGSTARWQYLDGTYTKRIFHYFAKTNRWIHYKADTVQEQQQAAWHRPPSEPSMLTSQIPFGLAPEKGFIATTRTLSYLNKYSTLRRVMSCGPIILLLSLVQITIIFGWEHRRPALF